MRTLFICILTLTSFALASSCAGGGPNILAYAEGTSLNKWFIVQNPTGAASTVNIKMYSNGAVTVSQTYSSLSIPAGHRILIHHSGLDNDKKGTLTALVDSAVSTNTVTQYNGDDAICIHASNKRL